ncbi:MAG: hypothetical protein V4712_05045 [Pseudomonadota bacterium]
MLRPILCLLAFLSLTACAGFNQDFATDAEVQAARYEYPGPSSITLYTVVSTRNGSGAHSGLLLNGSERVMFDPAGSWFNRSIPEQGDVHYGMTDQAVNMYIDYHARETFRVVEQTIEVPKAVADIAIARAKAYGAVPQGQCSNSISKIMSGVPGFEGLRKTWFPNKYSEEFAKLPGVRTRNITDDDSDENKGLLAQQAVLAPPAVN